MRCATSRDFSIPRVRRWDRLPDLLGQHTRLPLDPMTLGRLGCRQRPARGTLHVCMHACVCVRVCVCVCVRICGCMHVCMDACMYMHGYGWGGRPTWLSQGYMVMVMVRVRVSFGVCKSSVRVVRDRGRRLARTTHASSCRR